jgi:hypothetical protein
VTALRLAFLLLLAGLALAAPTGAAATRSYTGKLEVHHTDDFAHGRSATRYQLVRGHHRTALVLARSPRIRAGSAVVLLGRHAGSRLRGRLRPLRERFKAAAKVGTGTRKTAVILLRFDSADTPWTPEFVRERIFTASDSVNAFYKEDSYGDISLAGQVYGWYTVPPLQYSASDGCDVDQLAIDANAAAEADGFDPNAYDHVIYAFPEQAMCGWAGLGEIDGSLSWINGYIDDVSVVGHELGHNMGLHHASALRCSNAGTPVAVGGTCTRPEYGDPFDVMGTSTNRNNAWHLLQIGFLPDANVETVAANGAYTLNSTNTRGGTQLLRVPRPAGASPPYYDIDLRSPGGVFDNFVPLDAAVNGVMIHADTSPTLYPPKQSLLIDTTPGTRAGFLDAPLLVGRTFTDGPISITLDSVVGGVAKVTVLTGAPTPDVAPPGAPASLAAEPTIDHVNLSWDASTDDVGVAGYRVYRDGTLVQTTTATSWTDTLVTAGATYAYRVEAYDAAGNTASSVVVSATVPSPPPPVDPPLVATVAPPPPPGDTSAPAVRIVSPGSHAGLRRRAMVRAAAADLGGAVVRTEVWIDGRRRSVVAGGRLDWRWPLRHVRRGIHRVTVRALDAAGNVGKASVHVRVLR